MHIIRKVNRPDGRTQAFWVLEILDGSGEVETRYSYFLDEAEAAKFWVMNRENLCKR
jgi:hypothetical protein